MSSGYSLYSYRNSVSSRRGYAVFDSLPSTLLLDLWAYYTFDTGPDDSLGANNGVVSGGAVLSPGKINDGYYTDGNSGSIDFPGITGYDWTADDFSFSIWAYSDGNNATGIRGLFSNRTGASAGWFTLGILTSDLSIEVAGGVSYVTAYVPDGKGWVHYAVTKTGTTVKVYINGSLFSSLVIIQNMGGPGEVARVGEWLAPTQNWNGTMDELGLWKRVLTALEVSQLYNLGNGIQYPF